MSNLLCLEDIHISYGKTEIIRGISFEVKKGEFCALLGLNGSGKTTILHAVCGFIPMKGKCLVDSKDCIGLNEKQRAKLISFIPQVSSLSGGRSVLDVVMMGFNPQMHILQSHSGKQKQLALEMLKKLGLETLENHDFGRLSQGQKQLIILARCMVQNAPMMLMDEPDSALDFLNKHMVLNKIKEMIQSGDCGGLITLHDPNFALRYCDRIFLLKGGRIEAELVMKKVSEEEIRQKLSLIYGGINILQYNGGYLMGK